MYYFNDILIRTLGLLALQAGHELNGFYGYVLLYRNFHKKVKSPGCMAILWLT